MHDTILGSQENDAQIIDRILAIGQAVQEHITQNPRKVYELIVENVCQVTGADCAVIYPYHPAFGEFYDVDNVAAYGLHHELKLEGKVDKRKGLTARVHRVGEIIREQVEPEESDMPAERSFIARERIQAFMGLSLRLGEDILGILYVDYRKPHVFSEEEKRIIRLFGRQAAMAVSNSWAYRLAGIRARAVSRLKAVGQALGAIQDPSKTLDSVLEGIAFSAQDVLGADIVDLYQYIQAQDKFPLPPTLVGERWDPFVPKDKIYEDDVVVKAVRGGEAQYFHDAQETSLLTSEFEILRQDAPDKRFVVREGVASSAMIPLKAADEIVGVMFVNYRTPQFFDRPQRDVIESFALQAATAIYNARLFGQVNDQRQALAELNELAPLLISIEASRDPRDLLEQVARSAHGVLKADLIELYEYLPERDTYRLPQISVGERLGPDVVKDQIYKDDAVFQLIQRDEPLYVEQAQIDQKLSGPYSIERQNQPTERFAIREKIQSTAAIPLKVGGVSLGLMFASYRTPQAFTPEQKKIIELFASQASIAIHNSRLFNESLRQRNELQVVDEVGRLLMGTLDPREIPRLLLQQVIRLFGVGGASLWQVDRAGDCVKCLFSLDREGLEEPFAQTLRGMTFGFGEGIVGTVAQSGKPMIVNQVQLEPRWEKRVDEATGFETKSLLAVPLVHRQETIGVIEVLNQLDETPFTEGDRDFLAAIVSPAAIALENARLFYDVNRALERRVQALTVLNEVGQALTSDIRLQEDEILESIHEQARNLTGTEEMYIALYDNATRMIRFGLALEKGRRVLIEPRRANMERRGKTEEIIFTKRPLLHRTMQEVEVWYQSPGHQEFRKPVAPSWMGVPMMVGDEVLGMIAVYDWNHEQAYDDLDLQVLTSMASQAAIALNNVDLFRQLVATKQVATLGTAMAAIQHRINNTLNIIGPNLIRLRPRVDMSDETIQEILDIIERNTRYTTDYITRIQEPLKDTELQAVDVNASLRDAQSQVGGQFPSREGFGPVEVIFKLEESLPRIEASSGQITEIFRNLVENSYKAMGADGGTLTIASRRAGDWLEVEMRDTGPGIPPNILDKLFKKPVPSKQPGAGSGLGLWLSALLLQRYAGEISVKETGPTGTTMLVRLPVSRQ